MNTYATQKGAPSPGVVTGKPIELGGSEGRVEATGRGVITAANEACDFINMKFESSRVVVQGFGNVGSVAAKLAVERGAKVVGVSDRIGGVYNDKGLPIHELIMRFAD